MMAKKSMIEKDARRRLMISRCRKRRADLKKIVHKRDLAMEERFQAVLKLAAMPRNGSSVRAVNRCSLTGRPRGYHRKFGLSRIALRELASQGMLPGVTKASW